MTLDELRTCFRTAKNLAKIGDAANTSAITASIAAISKYIKEVYKTSNALDKAKCKLQYENFDSIINIIETKGLSDKRVLAFFGLVEASAYAPSFSDIMMGNGMKVSSDSPNTAENIKAEDTKKAVDKKDNLNEPIVESSTKTKTPCNSMEEGNTDKSDNTKVYSFYTPQSLNDFIGQQHIVKALQKEIAIAKNKGFKHLDNIMLFGNPGLGKSTLMRLIANELGVKFEKLDCSQFNSRQQSLRELQSFLTRVANENTPVVIAFDEIHALAPDLQTCLLTLLNDREFVSPPDKKTGNVNRIPIKEFTFIGATTDDDKILDTIKNRCLRLTFQLVDYSPVELKQIYQNKIAAKGLTITDDALDACVPRSRGAIRYVNAIVEDLDNALYSDLGRRESTHIDLSVVLDYFQKKGIDQMGLTEKDINILNVLKESTSDSMSADVLAARVGLKTDKYISEHEKYMIKIGFINVLPGKGRVLTAKAIKYLSEDGQSCGDPSIIISNNIDDGTESIDETKDIIDDIYGGN